MGAPCRSAPPDGPAQRACNSSISARPARSTGEQGPSPLSSSELASLGRRVRRLDQSGRCCLADQANGGLLANGGRGGDAQEDALLLGPYRLQPTIYGTALGMGLKKEEQRAVVRKFVFFYSTSRAGASCLNSCVVPSWQKLSRRDSRQV